MKYNESQEKAILHKDGPMLVLAGPGSGKTAVITRRVYELIHTYRVNAANILVITFTKAAAAQMKQRFFQLAGDAYSQVTFGTFHAVFFMMLKHAYHLDSRNIVTEERRYQFMREILSRYSLECQDENEFIGDLLAEISQIKNNRLNLDHFYSGLCGEAIFRGIYHDYAKCLARHRLMDFDDMLVYTYELLSERKDILSAWQKKYTYILIDEFQDINRLQYDIVRMLGMPENNLFIVGDDDQSIYRFRGSKPEIMLGFERDYPDAKRVQLAVNYRSCPAIVSMANRLIANNVQRFSKQVEAFSGERAMITYRQFEDIRKEYSFVTDCIKSALKRNMKKQEIAVLCRTNTQPRLLLEELVRNNLPFRTRDKIPNLYDHWIARDLFAYIRIGQGSRERSDILMIMNKPKRYIARDSLYGPQIDFKEWVKLYEDKPWIEERMVKLWNDIRLLSALSPYAAINYIRKGIGYDDYLKEYAQYRNIQVDELYDVIEEIQTSAKGYKSMEEWFLHIADYQNEMKEMAKAIENNPDAITVSTLHSAKGLEYEMVILPDVNEGVMPYKKSVSDADIEEERRLFYVGMTRAKRELVLCSVKSIYNKPAEVSRFIKETGLLRE